MDTSDINRATGSLDLEPAIEQADDQTRRGRRRRWWLFVALLAMFAVVFDLPGAVPAGWDGDFDAALAQAKAQNRHVVVAFHGAGCPPCHVMDRSVLGKPAVRAALVDFVPVRIDPLAHMDLAGKYYEAVVQEYGAYPTPMYAVLDTDGALVNQIVGGRTVDEFVAFLQTSLGMSANAQSPGT